MPDIYPKNKILKDFLVYGNIIVFSFVLVIAQNQIANSQVLFLGLFILLFITVVEVFDKKAGVFAICTALLFELPQKNVLLILGYMAGVSYYLVIQTLRKRKLEITAVREKHFRSLVNVSLQPLILKNSKGELLFASESIKDLLGVKKNLPVGTKISDFVHSEDIPLYNNFLNYLLLNPNVKKSIELRLTKNGSGYIWAKNDSINLLDHPHVKAILSSWQDITQQKTADFQKSEILKNEKDARAMAEKAVRDRDEFLSIASHELKTPLTTVLLQLQGTLRKILTQSLADFSGKDLLDSLQIAEKQSLSLSTLIKDLLNVSLASTGRLTLNKEVVNLTQLVETLVKKYGEEIKLSGCAVKVHNKHEDIIGNWDPVRIEQAITNLLMNALKYAKGQKITIETDVHGSNAIFKITDTGVGIPEELQGRIFQPFQRANRDSSIKGLGVGLFITRQIALSHGGSIEAESKADHGSTFTLKLPIS